MPSFKEIEAGIDAIVDECGGGLCAYVDMGTRRVCRMDFDARCVCRDIAIAALTAAEAVRENAGIGRPS